MFRDAFHERFSFILLTVKFVKRSSHNFALALLGEKFWNPATDILRSDLRLLVTVNVAPSSPIYVTDDGSDTFIRNTSSYKCRDLTSQKTIFFIFIFLEWCLLGCYAVWLL
jgi:hypothetical protein